MSALEKFGKFIIENLRDRAIEQHDMLLQGQLKALDIQELQLQVQSFSKEESEILRKIVIDVVDTAMHDLLFAIQEAHDLELQIEVFVDGKNVAEESGMLHGQYLGEEGWIKKYSRFAGE